MDERKYAATMRVIASITSLCVCTIVISPIRYSYGRLGKERERERDRDRDRVVCLQSLGLLYLHA